MMHMEIDVLSPRSYIRMRNISNSKRARSPDDGPMERPTKRLVLAFGSATQSRRNSSSASSSRHTSEDWVQQAGGLTIDSPLSTTPKPFFPDEDVPMDLDASDEPERPPLPLLQTSFNAQQLVHSQLQQLLPDINVLPPTPEIEITAATRPSTPCDSPGPMNISPTGSFLASPSRGRQRFTMGPRPDCEKCRLGLKGHYMHF
ncbi:hypothetical protein C8J56DRAFT_831822 [Mycena floridula]|nr:hypothetical protein C8J56DRAFT_831822 [Mycena floridula]